MTALLVGLLMMAGAPTDPFEVQTQLQGLYDEMSLATLQPETETDLDLYHTVLNTPDSVFLDQAGQSLSWPQVRQQMLKSLSAPLPDSVTQSIQKLSLSADGASTVVAMAIVRTTSGREGKHGSAGSERWLTETTIYHDKWVQTGDGWKLKSREQVGKPTSRVTKPEWGPPSIGQ